jgi:crossover junction endodeoxyribonuclease RuvC
MQKTGRRRSRAGGYEAGRVKFDGEIMEIVGVGLDLSLTGTGFCLKSGNVLNVETIKTKPKDFPNKIERVKHIVTEVTKRIPSDVSLVCVENYFVPANRAQIGAAMGLIELGWSVRLALYQLKIPFYVVVPQHLKKFGTGKGNCPKSIVIREVFKKWGFDAKDDNQADACVLANIAYEIAQWNENLPAYQLETIEKIVLDAESYHVPETWPVTENP